ncbi:hypothetical protein [Geobacter sp. SVR]|uniref:hypothetical protein n=1 Tax=Geobacter sp. SVR TaxID=2495594 RepID=UPI00143F012B|nr:hypothetical protein [Geobacter sp. SVR]BCS55180.1 hypothetical protein GSVR_34880 [Geobacter sp. SVR]GCF85361.1 hypothetical protein GSbR_19610 [Geobacter sp. SVR]
MNPAAIAQLIIVLAPLLQSAVIEGEKLITTFRSDLTAEELRSALQASLSATWPELTFGQDSPS